MARGFDNRSAARQWVWDRLSAEGLARFPFPPHGRLPNFAGAEVAAARLLDIEPWKSATAIKVNPDSPQRPLRAEALRPRHHRFRTDAQIARRLQKARSVPDSARQDRRGHKLVARQPLVRGGGLAEMPELDAIVCGSVAVTRDGRRGGKGEGYSDIGAFAGDPPHDPRGSISPPSVPP
jgi:5-formyltetrahydrofolate cyclo-ligase